MTRPSEAVRELRRMARLFRREAQSLRAMAREVDPSYRRDQLAFDDAAWMCRDRARELARRGRKGRR